MAAEKKVSNEVEVKLTPNQFCYAVFKAAGQNSQFEVFKVGEELDTVDGFREFIVRFVASTTTGQESSRQVLRELGFC